MPRPAQNPDDPRSRYTHQAYDVTYGGISPERGPSGRNMLLGGTYRASFMFTAPADETDAQIVGDLPQGVWISGLVIHEAIAAGTYKLVLKGVGGGSDHELVAAIDGDLTTAGEVPAADFEPVWAPLDNSRPLELTVTGGTADATVRMSILATPAESGWK